MDKRQPRRAIEWALSSLPLLPRCDSDVLELPPMASSQTATYAYAPGAMRRGGVALPFVVQSRALNLAMYTPAPARNQHNRGHGRREFGALE